MPPRRGARGPRSGHIVPNRLYDYKSTVSPLSTMGCIVSSIYQTVYMVESTVKTPQSNPQKYSIDNIPNSLFGKSTVGNIDAPRRGARGPRSGYIVPNRLYGITPPGNKSTVSPPHRQWVVSLIDQTIYLAESVVPNRL